LTYEVRNRLPRGRVDRGAAREAGPVLRQPHLAETPHYPRRPGGSRVPPAHRPLKTNDRPDHRGRRRATGGVSALDVLIPVKGFAPSLGGRAAGRTRGPAAKLS